MQHEIQAIMPELVAQLEKWVQMSVDRKVAYVRTVNAVKLLCLRFLPHLKFETRWLVLIQAVREILDNFPHLKAHWVEKPDGTKWIYFCEADPSKSYCGRCPRRIECLGAPDRQPK